MTWLSPVVCLIFLALNEIKIQRINVGPESPPDLDSGQSEHRVSDDAGGFHAALIDQIDLLQPLDKLWCWSG